MRSLVLLTALLLAAPATFAQSRADAPASDAALAESPALLTYSGLLTTADGTPLPDGTHQLVFRAYASPTGAESVWQETHDATVTGGQFWVMLGVKSPLADGAEWYTVAVDGAPESKAVHLGSGDSADGFAPGNTLDNSYDNGAVINVDQGRPMIFRGTPGSFYTGLQIKDITAVFSNEELLRFRLRSVQGGASWEYRVYGSAGTNNGTVPPGSFAISNASTPGAQDAFIIFPNAERELLRLDGSMVNIGSPVSEGRLSVYAGASGTPGVPSSDPPSFFVDSFSGNGATSWWREEDGTALVRVEPDINGDGGYFAVAAESGLAFQVDGQSGTGSRVFIGDIGPKGTVFDTEATGTEIVQLPLDAVDATEILNEAGVANETNSTSVSAPTGATTATLARSITTPASGHVLVMATAEIAMTHVNGTISAMQVSVSRDCDATPTAPGTQQTNLLIPAGAASGTYRVPTTVHGLFTAPAGINTFCLLGQVQSTGPTINFDDQNLTLLYVPTAYGVVSSNAGEGQDEQEGAPSAGVSAGDIAAERAEAVQANASRMQAELRQIQQRLAELEGQVGNQ